MTAAITFEIPGEPIGKGRPRFVRATGRAFTPAKTRTFEAVVKDFAQRAMGDREPLDCPIRLTIGAMFLHPASWSAKKRNSTVWKTSKPDADNILKICDALNGVVWRDDAQVAHVTVSKTYDARGRLVITVEPLT